MVRKILLFVEYVVMVVGVLLLVDTIIGWIPMSWWANLILTFAVNLTICMWFPTRYVRHRLAKRVEPQAFWVDPASSPDQFMNPHGDGTLRPGDPLYDNVFLPMIQGRFHNGAVVVRHEGGLFEVLDRKEEQHDETT